MNLWEIVAPLSGICAQAKSHGSIARLNWMREGDDCSHELIMVQLSSQRHKCTNGNLFDTAWLVIYASSQ